MDELGAALSENVMVSLVVIPEVETATVLEQEPEEIDDVPSAVVPEAKVVVTVPEEGNVAVDEIPVPPCVPAKSPLT